MINNKWTENKKKLLSNHFQVTHFLNNEARGTNIIGAKSLEDMVNKLKTPRKIMLLVKGKTLIFFIHKRVQLLDSSVPSYESMCELFPCRTKKIERENEQKKAKLHTRCRSRNNNKNTAIFAERFCRQLKNNKLYRAPGLC